MQEILKLTDDAVLRGVAVGLAAAFMAPCGVDIQQHIASYRYVSACNETTILCTDTAIATLRAAYAARAAIAKGDPNGIVYFQSVDPQAVHMAYRLVATATVS